MKNIVFLLFSICIFFINNVGFSQVNRYWVGNSGNWNDVNHWSNSSGGAGGSSIPAITDSVFFDGNSFSVANQIVTVNTNGSFKSMIWSNISQSQTLILDSVNAVNLGNLYAAGDVTLHSNLKVRRIELSCSFLFLKAGKLTPNGANIDANFRINMSTNAETLLLQNSLVMSDTSSFIMMQGGFNTQSNKFVTGTFKTLNDPGGVTDTRALSLGASSVQLVKLFQADSDPQFTLTAGTSNVYIGDTIQIIPDTISYVNGLLTSGLTFYNVTLNFQRVKYGPTYANQKVTGNNTFNKFKIIAGSRVSFGDGSNQTVNDSLLIIGTCADSIFVLSDGSGQFTITKTGTKVKVQCVQMEDFIISSAQTAYFSNNITNNGSNWTFNASDPITANFTSTSPDCFGSVTNFSPTTSTVFGEPVVFSWLFNDGSSVSYPSNQYTATNSLLLDYPQPLGVNVNDTLPMTNWTEVSDPESVFFPISGQGYPSSSAENMLFTFNIDLDFNLKNSSGGNAYLVDMDNNFYNVKAKYRPRIMIFKNGAPFASTYLISNSFIKSEGSIPNGVSLLADTVVSITVAANNLQLSDVFTFQMSVVTSTEGYPTVPRWKNNNLTTASDVSIGYQIDINSIGMTATPVSNYISGTNNHTFLESGDFNVVMIATNSVNQCTDTIIGTVNISGPTGYLTTSQIDTTICAGEQVIFGASSNTSGALFEFFVNGTSQGAPSTNDTLITSSITNNGIVTVKTTANGCTSVNDPSYQFVVNPLPTPTLTSSDLDNSICLGDNVSFTASPLGTNLYRYKKNNTFVTSYSLLGTYATTSLVNGDVVKLIAKSPAGCIDSTQITFTVNNLPTVTLTESSGDYIICTGESVTFTAGGALTYEFFINGVSQGVPGLGTFTTSTLSNGNIVSVKGYNASGCVKFSTTTFTYTVIALPTVSLTFNPGSSVCSGTNVSVNATGASLYQFFVNGTSQGAASGTSSINSTAYTNGSTFYVIGTSSGCSTTSSTITLTVNAAPFTVLTSSDIDNSICAGTSVTFTGSGASTYQFLLNGSALGAFSGANTYSSSVLSNGDVIGVIGQSNGCFVSQQLAMTVLNNPSVLLFSSDANNTICAGEPITFTGANASQYQLYVNGTSVAGPQASAIFNPALSVGGNAVYVVGTAANGCSGQSSTINTTVNANPVVGISSSDANNIICSGESVTFTGTGATMYQFFVSGSPQGSMSTTNTFTTTSLSNLQNVQITGSTLGCTSTSSIITTTVNPIPNLILTSTETDNNFCIGDAVTYTANGAMNYQFFVNSVSQGAPSLVNTLNASSFPIGSYTVSVAGSQSGCSAISTLPVTVNALPVAGLISTDVDNIICSGDLVNYNASGGNLYQFFVNGIPQGTASPLSSFSSTTLTNGNLVSVNVTNAAGCLSTTGLSPITVNTVPTTNLVSSDIDNQICIGDNVVFTGSGASTYQFFINGISQGAASPVNTLSTSSLTNNQTITVTGTTLGCSDISNQLTFAVFGPPSVQLFNNGASILCAGQSTNLQATGATNYQFTVNGLPVGVFSPTSTFTSAVNNGDIVSVIGQSNGCNNPSSDNFTFVVNNYPTITSTSSDADNIICLNDLVTFNTSGALTYDFEINGSLVQSGTSGTFATNDLLNGDIVSITGMNGTCASSPTNYNFTVNALTLNLSILPSALICSDEPVTFTASGADQYQFFVNGTSQGPLSANPVLTSTFTDLDEITFTGYSSTTGCTQSYDDYVLLNVIDAPMISSSTSLSICEGDSVILYSNASFGNQWYLNGTPIIGATDTAYVAYTSGDYSLETTSGGNGSIWSFGYNANGTFGNGSNINNPEPSMATTSALFDELASGYDFILGVTTSGSVFAWGNNSSGQLGNGTYTSSNLPISVPSLANIKTVAASESSSMAVTNSGTVYVWGNNSVGQLGTGNTSVINFPFLNNNLNNTDTIAGGKSHFVILKNDGTVWTVGSNDFGQLGNGNLNSSMNPLQIAGLNNIVSVGAGEYHSFAINNSGDLFVWGNNGSGQLGLNDINNRLIPTLSPLKNVTNAQGGAAHSIFLRTDKKVYTSGSNLHGQLGIGNNVDQLSPVETTISGAIMISAGEYSSLVRRIDNSVFGFGSNIEEQLSSTTGTSVNIPEHISDLDGVTFIEAGRYTSYVIYNESNACISSPSSVNMLTVPFVPISESAGILSTISGDSYQWYLDGAEIPGATSQTFVPANPPAGGNYSVDVTFPNGCTGHSTDLYFGPVGLYELSFDFSVYPNPTSGILNIKLNGDIDFTNMFLTVRDMIGREILLKPLQSNQDQIDISNFAVGNYIILLTNEFEPIGRIQVTKTN